MLNLYVPMTKRSEESDNDKARKKIDDEAQRARDLLDKGERIKALKLIEKTLSRHEKHESLFSHHELQGDIFFDLAKRTDDTDVKCLYLFASVDAYSMSILLCPNALRSFRGYARSMIQVGDQLRINKFYKKTISKAKRGLSVTEPQGTYTSIENYVEKLKKELEESIKHATLKINSNAALTVSATRTMTNQMVSVKKDPSCDRLKNFWVNLDNKTKREFLVVDFTKLIDYIENKYGSKVKEDFRKCVSAANNLQWKCWKCYICSQVNYCFTDCQRHILDNHVQKFAPERPKCVDKVLADMICCGKWEPVDTVAAANLIKDRTKRGEEFVYVNGWCSDWPVAEDEERKNILKQFAQVLKSSCYSENDTLSCTLWDWLIDYTGRNLQLLEVPGSYLDRWDFFQNPQCICFLDLKHLEHILKYLRQLTTTDVRFSSVPKVVNWFWENSRVKEKIHLERRTFNLLLDGRLLNEVDHQFDDIGSIKTYKSTGIYEDVIPQGDKIVSWILDCPKINEQLVSQMGEGVHNLEIWLAALRIVRRMVRKNVSYCDKKEKLLTYEKKLAEAEAICDIEDTRNNVNQRIKYAFALRIKCEELVVKDDDNKCLMSVIRDVLESATSPRSFEVLVDKEYMKRISGLSSTVQNHTVKKSLQELRNSLKKEFNLIDSKILLNDCTSEELHEFPKLSAVEYRLVVLPFVKMFLQDKLKKMMEPNSNSVAEGACDEPDPKRRHL